MIKKVVETWHRVVAGERPEELDSCRWEVKQMLPEGSLSPTR
jgi:hypothetical protein